MGISLQILQIKDPGKERALCCDAEMMWPRAGVTEGITTASQQDLRNNSLVCKSTKKTECVIPAQPSSSPLSF
ncbi:hypothetical protein XENTR_v10014582 [Xenopus tropicalis]|nr:hypothetical protein XENTR_v10014582 [Xenopus tropicalis]KAE8604128.1 hypothetical protein XENTR_v10014582 [Xenopus tropicalis]KAE8604129.1 hypothetical protein XENTR_v10014582 [Xenopus tropicalis]